MKVKLRPHPLLEAPGERDQTITATDIKLMMRALEEARRLNRTTSLAQLHHYMTQLGLGGRPPQSDVKMMEEALEDSRKRKNGWDISIYLHAMRGIGLDVEVKEEDRQAMEKMLAKEREGNPFNILPLAYRMRALGIAVELSDKEKEQMVVGDLNIQKIRRDGYAIARMLTELRGVGVYVEVYKPDRNDILERLDKARKEGDGWYVAAMHHYLRNLIDLPADGDRPAKTMPPLKEYVK